MKLEHFMTSMFEEAKKFNIEDWEVEKVYFEYKKGENKTILTVKLTDGEGICFIDATYQAKLLAPNHSRVELLKLDFYEE